MAHEGFSGDVLSPERIRRYLRTGDLRLRVLPVVDSTNTLLKELAAAGEAGGLALLAEEQTQGRGRMGRRFYSPPGTGLYMSLLLRPDLAAGEAAKLTACAAVAAAEAIETLSGRETQIKWVNDILMDGKKVCGILTEAATGPGGRVDYVVVGIGINTVLPAGGLPEELRAVAGAAFAGPTVPDLRCRLAAQVLDALWDYAAQPEAGRVYEAYRARSIVLGRSVELLSPNGERVRAQALDIDRDYSLLVRLTDGSVQAVRSGEVSLRL